MNQFGNRIGHDGIVVMKICHVLIREKQVVLLSNVEHKLVMLHQWRNHDGVFEVKLQLHSVPLVEGAVPGEVQELQFEVLLSQMP